MTEAVLAVLAGHDPAGVADTFGLEPHNLTDATQAYHAAGAIALERVANRWWQAHVRPSSRHPHEISLAATVGPRLDALVESGAASGWWFMNKPPGWRIRLHETQSDAARQVLDELVSAGAITAWVPAIYEPETAAFGGTFGMDIAHDLFCADTNGLLSHLRTNDKLKRRELSMLLINAMFDAARLDMFERGDVFARVADMRPQPSSDIAEQKSALTQQLRTITTAPADAIDCSLVRAPNDLTRRWRAAFDVAGRRFADAALASGQLNRGLRAILAHIVIFHWNRLRLPAATQALLAHAAGAAYLTED
jgi:thiopeptide-type bacteriocin biosynthesis protein